MYCFTFYLIVDLYNFWYTIWPDKPWMHGRLFFQLLMVLSEMKTLPGPVQRGFPSAHWLQRAACLAPPPFLYHLAFTIIKFQYLLLLCMYGLCKALLLLSCMLVVILSICSYSGCMDSAKECFFSCMCTTRTEQFSHRVWLCGEVVTILWSPLQAENWRNGEHWLFVWFPVLFTITFHLFYIMTSWRSMTFIRYNLF